MAESSWQPMMSAAQRRRQRRLRSWWRHEQQSIAAALATSQHHSALQGQKKARAGEGDFELNFAAKILTIPLLRRQAPCTIQWTWMMCLPPGAPGQTVCSTCLDRRSECSAAPWSRLSTACRVADFRCSRAADGGPAGGSAQATGHRGSRAGDRSAQDHFPRRHPAARSSP